MVAGAATIVDTIEHLVLGYELPNGISKADVRSFFTRHRPVIVDLVQSELSGAAAPTASAASRATAASTRPPRSASKRTKANLAALQMLVQVEAGKRPPDARSIMRAYTGWGGLSIDNVRDEFPPGAPVPDSNALIHEYYTPSVVTDAVAQVLKGLMGALPTHEGHVVALEPSAGVGRFIDSMMDVDRHNQLSWRAVEMSDASARLLQALHPTVPVHRGTFESWVVANGDLHGKVGLVLANPPYGKRGASITDDPDRSYRDTRAYAYFLRRGLDLLAKDGIGVFVVPAGFLSGTGSRASKLRTQVLRRHHLLGAYRLPSGTFPGAQLVTDLLFFRARGGELAEVAEEDAAILRGAYYEEHPSHILGEEVGRVSNDDVVTKKPRWGYQIKGTFTGLPTWRPRPLCVGCGELTPFQHSAGRSGSTIVPSGSIVRTTGTTSTEGLPHAVARAVSLGGRVDTYLAAVARRDAADALALHADLVDALTSWVTVHGNPRRHTELAKQRHVPEIGRFLTAFQGDGSLIAGIATVPSQDADLDAIRGNIIELAEWVRSTRRPVTRTALRNAWVRAAKTSRAAASREMSARLPELERAGWRPVAEDEWMHPDDFVTGDLWPRVDRIDEALNGDARQWTSPTKLRQMRDDLMAAIAPVRLEQMGVVEPRAQWIPLRMVSAWLSETYDKPVTLVREGSVLTLQGVDYTTRSSRGRVGPVSGMVALFIGWCNHDRTVFQPKHPGRHTKLTTDDERLRLASEWTQSWESWVRADRTRVHELERLYNRTMRGHVPLTHSSEPLHLARWATGPGAIRLHPHQAAGVRRVVANNGGLLAYDVGVGKTYTAIGILARMRELGRKRPVIVVPNSIIWKWADDIARVLPDYEVLVIGSDRRIVKSGKRKGQATSVTDTPAERADKWTRFQSGEADVVLCTYSTFGRTSLNAEWVEAYVENTPPIKRMLDMQRRNALDKDDAKRSEREQAIVDEGARAWVAQRLELPAGQVADPGIAWDDIGVDLLIIDEAQNFKNLYLPEAREGGVPRFMGNAGPGSQRAWQLDFRAASVRERANGGGVVLLSATPAKNSPLEFYSMLQYVDGKAWEHLGIYDSEAFISRFCQMELKQTFNGKMKMVQKSACTGFKNLDELRAVVFRYGEFLTGEDVGLKLPEAEVKTRWVAMSDAQEKRYVSLLSALDEAMKSRGGASQILGILSRMALVSIHPELEHGYKWKTALTANVVPESPKFTAVADQVLVNPKCGHIIFLDNTAGHAWLKQTLVNRGIPEGRIAVLSAETARAPADRLRIARAFNGGEGKPPQYDVVICNQVAYEGIDLQTRTCSIHHVDLPWEPATLQQRNGRGVRQGNTLSTIGIFYYLAERSIDGLRFNLISGKLGWMKQLVKGTDRATTNPGASMELSNEELMLALSRDPEATQKQFDAMKRAARIAENAAKAEAAGRLLRTANARFRGAERQAVNTDASEERAEGEALLAELAAVDPEAWPYYAAAERVRTTPMTVTPHGVPVWEGLVIAMEGSNKALFGRAQEREVGVLRGPSWNHWTGIDLSKVDATVEQEGVVYDAQLTPDERQAIQAAMSGVAGHRGYSPWHGSEMVKWACGAYAARLWAQHGTEVIAAAQWAGHGFVPVERNGRLRVVKLTWGDKPTTDEVLAPTEEGFRQFLALFDDLDGDGRKAGRLLAKRWWGRTVPRNRKDEGRTA